MNPVLLKPESESGAQVVVQGRVLTTCGARDYHALKPTLLPAVLASFAALAAEAEIVLVEGAGSPAEVNLREGDIANMGFALAAAVPVALVGDIERGGVIAQLVGTMALLEPAERALVKGYIVNKLRGDPQLLEPAHAVIRAHTGLAGLGVVTWLEAARRLPQEDVLGLGVLERRRPGAALRVVVPRLPRIANFDDLDPLALEPDIDLVLLQPGEAVPGDADLVLLPGSKATIADLVALRREGWDVDILAHARRGGHVLGLCGGYQMLGREIRDPQGVEGPPGTVPGLGLLDVVTELLPGKTVRPARAVERASGLAVEGYEIHLGRTTGPGTDRPMLTLDGRGDGAVGHGGRVMGCYLHGLLAADGFRHAYLRRIRDRAPSPLAYAAAVEAALDEVAEHLERCLDLAAILRLAGCR
jgi:adenosylcobyric acid synthase